MRKVTLRSLWEHKRRLVSTVVAIVLGVAFMSGTFVLRRHPRQGLRRPLRRRQRGRRRAGRRARCCSARTSAAINARRLARGPGRRPSPTSTGSPRPQPFVSSHRLRADQPGARRRRRHRSARRRARRRSSSRGSTTTTLNPSRAHRGAAARDRRRDRPQRGRRRRRRARRSATPSRSARQFGNERVRARRDLHLRRRRAAPPARCRPTSPSPRPSASPGPRARSTTSSSAPTKGVTPEEVVANIAAGAAGGGRGASPARRPPSEDASSVQEGFAFFRQLLTIFGGHRPARRHLHHLQHLLDPRRPADTGAGAAPGRRCQPAPGAHVGAPRGDPHRARRRGARPARRHRAGGGHHRPPARPSASTSRRRTLVVSGQTVVIALIVGLVVTVVAAVIPAIRATRVPPLAALRDVAIDRSGASRIRIGLGVVVLALGAFNLSQAWTARRRHRRAPGRRPRRPAHHRRRHHHRPGAGRTLGPDHRLAPAQGCTGVTGRLAMENAARSPKRTSATASALLIGVALVGFITVFAASAKASVEAEVNRGIRADLIVQAESGGFGFSGFSPAVADTVAEVDGVDAVASFGFGEARVRAIPTATRRRQLHRHHRPRDRSTSSSTPRMEEGEITDLTDDGIVVDRQIAEDNDLAIGDRIVVTAPGGGTLTSTIQGISDDTVVLGFWTVTQDRVGDRRSRSRSSARRTPWSTTAPTSTTVQAAVEEAIAAFPGLGGPRPRRVHRRRRRPADGVRERHLRPARPVDHHRHDRRSPTRCRCRSTSAPASSACSGRSA